MSVVDRLRNVRREWRKIDRMTIEAALVLVAETTALLKIIWQLPDRSDRLVLVEYYLLQKTVRQIADENGITEDAVYRQKRIALERFQ